MKSGIYIITNKLNNKVYIGKSFNANRRILSHIALLKRNVHPNKHLQNSWNNNTEIFTFSVLENCDKKCLSEREFFWINKYNACDRNKGYNLELPDPNDKKIVSEETRQKLRDARKGKTPRRGYKLSEETKQKISKSLIGNKRGVGRKITEETRIKLSNSHKGHVGWNKGKTASEETRQKLRDARKGKTPHPKGSKMSEEAKRKISNSLKTTLFLKKLKNSSCNLSTDILTS